MESYIPLKLSFKYEGKINIFGGMQELHEVYYPCILLGGEEEKETQNHSKILL